MTNKFNAIFGWGVAAVIIAAIIGGLMMVGGPSKARDQKIDANRLQNMQFTARVISCYADDNNGLPASVDTIKAALKNNAITRGKKQQCRNLKWGTDRVTKAEFEYNRLDKSSFELCGVFARPASKKNIKQRPVYNAGRNTILDTNVSRLGSGRFCYGAKNWT